MKDFKSITLVSDSLRLCWKGSALSRDTWSRTSSCSLTSWHLTGCKLQITDYRLLTTDYKICNTNYRLQTMQERISTRQHLVKHFKLCTQSIKKKKSLVCKKIKSLNLSDFFVFKSVEVVNTLHWTENW